MKIERQLDILLQIIALYELETASHLRDAKLVAIRELLSRSQTTISELETLVCQIIRRTNLARIINPKREAEFTFYFDGLFFRRLRSVLKAVNCPPLQYDEGTDSFTAPPKVDFVAPTDCLWGLCYQVPDEFYIKESSRIAFDYCLAPAALVRTASIAARCLSGLSLLTSFTNVADDLHRIENLNRIMLDISAAKALQIFRSSNRGKRDRLLQAYEVYLELVDVDTVSI